MSQTHGDIHSSVAVSSSGPGEDQQPPGPSETGSVESQMANVNQDRPASTDLPTNGGGNQGFADIQWLRVPSADPALSNGGQDHVYRVAQAACVPPADLPGLIAHIQHRCWQRRVFHKSEKSLTLQMKAVCRHVCDGDKTEANRLFKAIEKAWKGKIALPFGSLMWMMTTLLGAREPIARKRKAHEEALKAMARQLPVWPWIEATHGVGPLSLALIVGEAGDLSNYSGPAKLWKRFGVAVIDGERQRKCTDPEKAKLHGYNPSRRSALWTIGDCIIKAGNGEFKRLYDQRKVYEAEQHRDFSKGHVHNRAKRWMEKRFLKLLWAEWRRCHGQSGTQTCPAPSPPPEEAG